MRLIPARVAVGAALSAAVLAAALTPAASPPALAALSARAGHAGTALPAGAVRACLAPAPDHAACTLITAAAEAPATARVSAHLRGHARAAEASSVPAGLGPLNLQATYKLPAATGGVGQVVAFVAAGADPTAEADLATYRSQWALPPCTISDGCLTIENQNGGSTLPTNIENGWPANDALGMDIISAICPNCHILLIEANSTAISDLAVAANTAGTTSGVHFVDNAYAGQETSTETSFDAYYDHPGVAMVAAAGDTGYTAKISYPAASPYVISVGGTVLTESNGIWADTSAWSGSVSGCSLYESAKPSWQHDTGCAGRTDNDLAAAAAADETGGIVTPLFIAFYNTSNTSNPGWTEGGGTTASASIITGIYALAGTPAAGSNPASYPYAHASLITDITTGSTGTCSIAYLCTAGKGYDGPTGLGSPASAAALGANAPANLPGLILNINAGLCLGIKGSSGSSGASANVGTCTIGSQTQTWRVRATVTVGGDFGYQFENGVNLCLGVAGGSTSSGAQVVQGTCDPTSDHSQIWRPMTVKNGVLTGFAADPGAGYYWLDNGHSGMCLDVKGSPLPGALVIQDACNLNSPIQYWFF